MALQARPLKTKMTIDKELNRTYTSSYLVANTPLYTSPSEVINASGIPNYWLPYTWNNITDPYAVFSNLDVDPRDQDPGNAGVRLRDWIVTVTHSTKDPPQRDPNIPRGNPINEPPRLAGSFLTRMITAVRDKDDNPIVNTAKMPFDPPLQTEDSMDTLQIEYNTKTINLKQRSEYRNTVNSVAMWGLQPRQIKLTRWAWSVRYVPGYDYIRHQFEFNINYESFFLDPVNQPGGDQNYQGYYTLVANRGYDELIDGNKHKLITENDEPLTYPSKLNEDGTRRAPDEEETWLVFELEKEKDFLQIPGMPKKLPGPFVNS